MCIRSTSFGKQFIILRNICILYTAFRMKFKLSIIVLVLFPILGYAQGISGCVIDSNGQPISQATILLYTVDSMFVETGISTEDGFFKLDSNIRPYRLRVQHIAFKPHEILSSQDKLGNIALELKSQELENIVVTAKRPTVSLQNGRLTFNPQQLSKLKVLSTAFDLLCETPGLQSADNENISVSGVGGTPAILINGQPSTRDYASTLLYIKSLPASRVRQIEVVHNAPPEWNVKGAAVNIIIKEELSDMLNAQFQTQWKNRHANSFDQTISVMFSKGRLSADFMYKIEEEKSINQTSLFVKHNVFGNITDIYNQTRRQGETPISHNIYMSVNYSPLEKHRVNLSYNATLLPSKSQYISSNNSILGISNQLNVQKNNLQNISVEYSMPKRFRIGAEYLYFNTRQVYTGKISETPVSYSLYQKINKYHTYFRGQNRISDRVNLSYGVNYTYTNSHSEQTRLRTSTSNENIVNVFLQAGTSFFSGKMRVNAALVGEWYRIQDYQKKSILPNITIGYRVADNHLLNIGYQAFHNYPNYWLRQNYIQEVDGYEIRLGNPDLKVARYNLLSMNYIFKQKYFLTMSYYRVRDAFFTQRYQANDKLQSVYQVTNNDLSELTHLSLTFPVTIANRWYLTFIPSSFYERFKMADWHNLSFDISGWTANMTVKSQLRLFSRPKLIFTTRAFAGTSNKQGIMKVDGVWFVDAGLQMSLIKDMLQIGLHANDIFESSIPMLHTRFKEQWSDYDWSGYSRSIILSVTYRFSKYKEQTRKMVDTSRMGIQGL